MSGERSESSPKAAYVECPKKECDAEKCCQGNQTSQWGIVKSCYSVAGRFVGRVWSVGGLDCRYSRDDFVGRVSGSSVGFECRINHSVR